MGWLEKQLGDNRPATLRWIERGVDRAGSLLVFLMPASNVVCVLVGFRRMRPGRFATFLLAGIAFRLVWIWIAAKQFESELKDALDWIEKYQWHLVIGFIGLTVAQSFRKAARQASTTEPARTRPDESGEPPVD
jgi:membrane protein DedA with SNARE-associated domain